MSSKELYSVAVTAVIEKDGKYLITKRPLGMKRFPGRWTVPGGKLEPSDYKDLPKDSENEWYNVLEKVVRREVREEVGIEIKDIDYITSILVDYGAKEPGLILSFSSMYASGEITPNVEEVSEAVWVDLDEAKKYDLIGDIYGELVMVSARKRGIRKEWHPSLGKNK